MSKFAMLAFFAVLVVLTACGGGGTYEEEQDEGRKTIQPPACQVDPKQCS